MLTSRAKLIRLMAFDVDGVMTTDPRFSTYNARTANIGALYQLVDQAGREAGFGLREIADVGPVQRPFREHIVHRPQTVRALLGARVLPLGEYPDQP